MALPTLYAEDGEYSATILTRIPTGGLNDQHALRLALTAHLVQIILSADFGEQGKTVCFVVLPVWMHGEK